MLSMHAITQTSAGQLSRLGSAARGAYKNACNAARPYVIEAAEVALDAAYNTCKAVESRVQPYFDAAARMKYEPKSKFLIDLNYQVTRRKAAQRPQLVKDVETASKDFRTQYTLEDTMRRNLWAGKSPLENGVLRKKLIEQTARARDAGIKWQKLDKQLRSLDANIKISEADKKLLDLRETAPDMAEALTLVGALTAYEVLKNTLVNIDDSVSKLSSEEVEQLLECARKETEMELVR